MCIVRFFFLVSYLWQTLPVAHSSPAGCLAYRPNHDDCSMGTVASPVALWSTAAIFQSCVIVFVRMCAFVVYLFFFFFFKGHILCPRVKRNKSNEQNDSRV